MPNSENLIPNSERSPSELKKMRSNGGKKSGEVRRAKKTMKQMLDYLLEKEITNKAGETATTMEAIMVQAIKQAMSGNVRALEFIRDTIGQNPRYTTELNINQNSMAEFMKGLEKVRK